MNEIPVDLCLSCVRIGRKEVVIVKESSHMRTELYTITVQLITGLHCLASVRSAAILRDTDLVSCSQCLLNQDFGRLFLVCYLYFRIHSFGVNSNKA